MLAELRGQTQTMSRITGGGSDVVQPTDNATGYRGRRGLDPQTVAQIRHMFGFDKPPLTRYLEMIGSYLRFDFGRSFFRGDTVMHLVLTRLPVSISIGLWSTLLIYLVSIPLGIAKAVRDGSRFDVATSAAVLVGYAVPGFLFAILLIVVFAGGSFFDWFPLRGLTSDGSSAWPWPRRVGDYAWHMVLPTIALVAGGFASLTILTKNCFLDEINKQYVLTARAKGAGEQRVLYGHVFRNAMLLIVAGFPAAFIGILFSSALLVEIVFSLDGLGLLGYDSAIRRDYPVMFGTLYMFTLIGLLLHDRWRSDVHAGRSPDRFRTARLMSPLNQRRFAIFRSHRRGWWSLWIFLILFVVCAAAELVANDRPLLIRYDGQWFSPVLHDYGEDAFGPDFLPIEADYTDPDLAHAIDAKGWMIWPAIPFSYDTVVKNLAKPSPTPPSWRNLLGTDDQARDVLARVIYGFRISVLFGFVLTIVSSILGVAAGAVQGFYGGLTDLLFQRFIEIWSGMPQLFLLIILSSIITPGFWVLLLFLLAFSWMALTRGGAGGVSAGPQPRLRPRGPGAGGARLGHHVAPHLAERTGGHAHLPPVHPVLVGHRTGEPGLPRLRFAAGFAVAR